MRARLLLTGLSFILACHSFSQMTGWSHSSPITVAEHSGALVTNYQLRLTLNTADLITAGEMLATGDDIRFTSSCTGGTEFNYWIESGMNTTSTVVWVKIDTLEANSYRTIYFQYGNPSATTISSIPSTFNGANSATDSITGGVAGGVTNSQRGVRFMANEDVLVTSFGKMEPNGTTRYITLFDQATQAILRQMQVSGPAAQYSYQDLASPIWLNQGQTYLLEMYQNSTDGYYFGPNTNQIGQHLTYLDMRYCNGCDQNTFPNNYLNSIHYGYPDLWYYTKTNVTPAPTYVLESFHIALDAEIAICYGDTIAMPMAVNGGEEPYTIAWTGAPVSDPTIMTPLISPSDTSEYYISVSDNCGFSAEDTITVNVKPLPSLTITSTAPVICNGEFAELIAPSTTDDYLWLSDGSTSDTVVVMPSHTTTYVLEATNVHGCSDLFSYEQVVNEPVLATQDVDICANTSYMINNHTYIVAGTYIDTLVGVTNCDSIITTNLTILPLPTATHDVMICWDMAYEIGGNIYTEEGTYIDTIPGIGCDSIITTNLTIQEEIDSEIQVVNELILVADVGADAYAWVDCNNGNTLIPGANGPVFEATANGSYAALLTVGNCVQVSNCIDITTVGLEEYDLVENISVFPNPNNGTFTVQSSASQEILVINALGQTIAAIDVIAGQPKQVELNNLEAGMYFLSSRTKVVRVIVE